MEVITYSLRDDQKNSDQYYREISAFTDEVIAEVIDRSESLLMDFIGHLEKTGREVPRSLLEYAFEYLMLGVLWRENAGHSRGIGKSQVRLMKGLVRLRKVAWLKPVVDLIRGVAGSLTYQPRLKQNPPLNLERLRVLLDWMESTGDFDQEASRLRTWEEYFSSLDEGKAGTILENSVELGGWFEERSLEMLGQYTRNVEKFLAEKSVRYRWREDRVFCGRSRVEYHLSMIGAEVLNNAYRDSFLATPRKLVLVPPCMRAQSDKDCKAIPTPHGDRCMACTPGCAVNQVTRLGEKHGFDVLIITHELSVFSSEKPSLKTASLI